MCGNQLKRRGEETDGSRRGEEVGREEVTEVIDREVE